MPRLYTLTFCLLIVFACNTVDLLADRNVPISHINKAISGNYLQSLELTTLKSCADRCVFTTDCMAVSFHFYTEDCVLYTINSSKAAADGDLMDENNAIVVDVYDWIQDKTGGCWDRPCPPHSICKLGKQTVVCEPFGCTPFILPEHGITSEPDKQFFQVGFVKGVGCGQGYLTTNIDPRILFAVTCMPNGNFEHFKYRCYTVQELCGDYILEKMYDASTASISLDEYVTVPDEIDDLVFSSSLALSLRRSQANITVTFTDDTWVGGVATKGGKDNGWIISYQVGYSYDVQCSNLIYFNDTDGEIKTFPANNDDVSVVENHFGPVKIRCIRLYLMDFYMARTLELELLGCPEE